MEVDRPSNIEIINAAAIDRADKCLAYVLNDTVELEDGENEVYGLVNVCIHLGAEPLDDTTGSTKGWKSVFDESIIEAAYRRNNEQLRYELVTEQYGKRLRQLTRLVCKLADVHCEDADKEGWNIDFGTGFRVLHEAKSATFSNQSSY